MSERHVTEFLAEVFRRAGIKRSLKRAEAVLLWPRVVGTEVARFSTARALRDGVLYVDVTDSETGMHLSLQRNRFLSEYRGTYGVDGVQEIRFQVGRVTRHEEAPPAPDVPAPDPQAVAEMARRLDDLELPEGLGAVALQAGRRFLAMQEARRAAGWVPCRACGALHDGEVRPLTQREEALQAAGRVDEELRRSRELCAACARYAREGRVVDAAGALMFDPNAATEALAEEERAVALVVAADRLDRALKELMPAAALDRTVLPQLELAARCRLALQSGSTPAEVSLQQVALFDLRLAQLLRDSFQRSE